MVLQHHQDHVRIDPLANVNVYSNHIVIAGGSFGDHTPGRSVLAFAKHPGFFRKKRLSDLPVSQLK